MKGTRYRKVHACAVEALGTSDKATKWLATPNRAIGGKAPEALLVTDNGVRMVLQLLGRIEHGVVS